LKEEIEGVGPDSFGRVGKCQCPSRYRARLPLLA